MPKPGNTSKNQESVCRNAAEDIADLICTLDEAQQKEIIKAFKCSHDFPTTLASLQTGELQSRTLRKLQACLDDNPHLASASSKTLTAVFEEALTYVVNCEQDTRTLVKVMGRLSVDEQLRLAKMFKRTHYLGPASAVLNSTTELQHQTLVHMLATLRREKLLDLADAPTRAFMRAMENVVRAAKRTRVRELARQGTAIAEVEATGVRSADASNAAPWVVFPHKYWQSEMHGKVLDELRRQKPRFAEVIEMYYENEAGLKGIQDHFRVGTTTAHKMVKQAESAYGEVYRACLADEANG